jgi:predicted NBD/HSP70 family sugar kinase
LPLAEGWKEVPLADLTEKRYGCPTELLNLVHASTLAEVRFGVAKDVRDMVFLHIGRGIAVGLMTGGVLCRGAAGNAGEFGHTVVRDDAPLCYCGNRGCLESLASPKAIVERCCDGLSRGVRSSLATLDPEKMTLSDILSAADAGDKLSRNTVEDAGGHIGGQLANLINVLNPAVLMFGGLLAENAAVLTGSIRRAFRSRVLPLLRDATRIEMSSLREDACAMGGAALIFDRLFATPESLLGKPTRKARNHVHA